MEHILDYLKTSSSSNNPFPCYLFCTALFLGALQLTSMALKTLAFIYRHTLKSACNFATRYSQGDSWAVVTGGSDGIGEQFCKDMAAKGFNICIIARTEQKMRDKLRGIEAYAVEKGKKIKTRYVVCDLAKATKYEEYGKIAEALKDIDVAMLFLNAGWTCMGPFKDLTP